MQIYNDKTHYVVNSEQEEDDEEETRCILVDISAHSNREREIVLTLSYGDHSISMSIEHHARDICSRTFVNKTNKCTSEKKQQATRHMNCSCYLRRSNEYGCVVHRTVNIERVVDRFSACRVISNSESTIVEYIKSETMNMAPTRIIVERMTILIAWKFDVSFVDE
jgi:hypothetical protein